MKGDDIAIGILQRKILRWPIDDPKEAIDERLRDLVIAKAVGEINEEGVPEILFRIDELDRGGERSPATTMDLVTDVARGMDRIDALHFVVAFDDRDLFSALGKDREDLVHDLGNHRIAHRARGIDADNYFDDLIGNRAHQVIAVWLSAV